MPLRRRDSLLGGQAVRFRRLPVGSLPTITTLPAEVFTLEFRYIFIRCEKGPLRYRVDGNDPTLTVGLPLGDGDYEWFSVDEARKFRVVASIFPLGSGILSVVYYK